MAKDAKGHGSDTRGSNYARQAPTKNGRARMYGTSMADRIKIAQDQQNIKEGRSAGSPGNPLGQTKGWGQYGSGDTESKYHSLDGRKDALVRTEPMSGGYLWQHGSQYGYANSVHDAKATVESRVADEARANTHNSQGHAWGSPEALKDFSAKYNPPGFKSGAREINNLRKRGK